MLCIGADPGQKGCLVAINAHTGQLVSEIRYEKFSDAEFVDRIKALHINPGIAMVLMEQVHGKASAIPMFCAKCKKPFTCACGQLARGIRPSIAMTEFKLGAAYGEMKMAIISQQIRLELISPQAWMLKMKVQGKKQNPHSIRDKAQQLFPEAAPRPTLNTGDAYLLAWLAREKFRGAA